jgi:hypothetical protein
MIHVRDLTIEDAGDLAKRVGLLACHGLTDRYKSSGGNPGRQRELVMNAERSEFSSVEG